jgi:hypothetical protein
VSLFTQLTSCFRDYWKCILSLFWTSEKYFQLLLRHLHLHMSHRHVKLMSSTVFGIPSLYLTKLLSSNELSLGFPVLSTPQFIWLTKADPWDLSCLLYFLTYSVYYCLYFWSTLKCIPL